MQSGSQVRFMVVGSSDRQLEEMLRQGGANVSSHPVEALTTLPHATAGAPDALVVDLRERAEVPPALALVKRHFPQLGVVIVASQLDPTLMLAAMRAGVNEWVAEPVTPTGLASAIQRVVSQRSPKSPAGQCLAFVGAKGGVGTTTVAVNVAAAFAAAPPRKALLVDLHAAHGDSALFLGVEPRFSTADALENIHRLDDAYLKGLVTTTRVGVHLLASAERPILAGAEARQVRELIEFVTQRYAYVVLDVPRADLTMLDSLEAVSSIVVVANQELATVRRAASLALTLRQRYSKDRVSVVINRFDRNAEIGREDIERVTGAAVRFVIPSDYRVALAGLNTGEPVVVQNHSRLAASFSSLARLLAGQDAAPRTAQERPAGLFGRLGMVRS